jgi:hypothetical protein
VSFLAQLASIVCRLICSTDSPLRADALFVAAVKEHDHYEPLRVVVAVHTWSFVIACVLTSVRSLWIFTVLSSLGPLMNVLSNIMSDIKNFAMLFGIVVVGFYISFSFAITIGLKEKYAEDYGTLKDFSSPYTSIMSLLKAGTGSGADFDQFSHLHAAERVTMQVVLLAYILATTVVLLNLLIAMMATTYNNVIEKSRQEALFVRGQTIYRYDSQECEIAPPLNIVMFLVIGCYRCGEACKRALKGAAACCYRRRRRDRCNHVDSGDDDSDDAVGNETTPLRTSGRAVGGSGGYGAASATNERQHHRHHPHHHHHHHHGHNRHSSSSTSSSSSSSTTSSLSSSSSASHSKSELSNRHCMHCGFYLRMPTEGEIASGAYGVGGGGGNDDVGDDAGGNKDVSSDGGVGRVWRNPLQAASPFRMHASDRNARAARLRVQTATTSSTMTTSTTAAAAAAAVSAAAAKKKRASKAAAAKRRVSRAYTYTRADFSDENDDDDDDADSSSSCSEGSSSTDTDNSSSASSSSSSLSFSSSSGSDGEVSGADSGGNDKSNGNGNRNGVVGDSEIAGAIQAASVSSQSQLSAQRRRLPRGSILQRTHSLRTMKCNESPSHESVQNAAAATATVASGNGNGNGSDNAGVVTRAGATSSSGVTGANDGGVIAGGDSDVKIRNVLSMIQTLLHTYMRRQRVCHRCHRINVAELHPTPAGQLRERVGPARKCAVCMFPTAANRCIYFTLPRTCHSCNHPFLPTPRTCHSCNHPFLPTPRTCHSCNHPFLPTHRT